MPIRPELRKYYGPEWRRYRVALLEIAGHRCAKCGAAHRYLNCAHMTHDPRNGGLITVLCPSCHATYDSAQRFAVTRRTRARRAGQQWLTPALEYAPFPSWQIPPRVAREAQARLFE